MLREVETADSLSDGLWGMTGGTQSAAGGKRWQRRQEETQWYYPSITSITSLAPGYQEMEKQHLWFSSTLVCAAFCATLHHDLAVNVLTCAPVTRHASCSILHVPSCQVECTEYLTFHKYLAWRCRKPRHVYHSGEIQTPYKVPVINCVNDFFSVTHHCPRRRVQFVQFCPMILLWTLFSRGRANLLAAVEEENKVEEDRLVSLLPSLPLIFFFSFFFPITKGSFHCSQPSESVHVLHPFLAPFSVFSVFSAASFIFLHSSFQVEPIWKCLVFLFLWSLNKHSILSH